MMKVKLLKMFDVILKDIKKKNGRNNKPMNVTEMKTINECCLLIMKLLSPGKTLIKKDYGFDEVFNILMK